MILSNLRFLLFVFKFNDRRLFHYSNVRVLFSVLHKNFGCLYVTELHGIGQLFCQGHYRLTRALFNGTIWGPGFILFID